MILNLGNRVVNNYLIQGEDGYILIDTGYENGYPRFLRNLKKAHIEPNGIKYIFLTHAHDDHAGFLNQVLSITDAKVILHPAAIGRLHTGQNSFKGGCSSRLAYFFCLLLALAGKGEHRYPAIKEEYMDRLIPIGTDAFRKLDFPYTVIETPGHTEDHISLLDNDILFCGDAAMNNFPSIHRVIIWIEDLKQFKQSWHTIIDLNLKTIYPAHGKPFAATDLKRNLPYLDRVKLYPLRSKAKE